MVSRINQRLITEEGRVRTYFAAEGGQVLSEYVEYGTGSVPQWAKSYVYLGARLLSTHTSGSSGEVVQYQHPDRLGTRLVTNASDTNSFEQATLPYGTALGAESTGASDRRFTSYERSQVTGLDYAVNRHYDSQQGRFTQVDPIGMNAASPDEPQSLNLYAYCGNDPVNSIDPEGLFFGSLLRGLGRAFSAVFKWGAAAAGVAVLALAFVTGQPGAFLLAGLLFAAAFGGDRVQRILGAAGAAASIYSGGIRSLGGIGPGGTAVFNPDAGSGLLSSQWRGYVLHQNDDEVVSVTTRCPRVGTTPLCPGTGQRGVGQPGTLESLIPVWGSGRAAVDHFQNGRWGWGIAYTALAVSDVFLVKSLVTSGGRLLARGGTEIVERAMSRAELQSTLETGLVRGGREGTHFVSDAVNHSALRARQRLALPQTPQVRVRLEVPSGIFSSATRVDPAFGMLGGGTERFATGRVPARVVKVWRY